MNFLDTYASKKLFSFFFLYISMSSSQLNLHQLPMAAPEPEKSETSEKSEKSKRELDSTDHDGDVQAEQAGKLHRTDAEFEKLDQELAKEKDRADMLELKLLRLRIESKQREYQLKIEGLTLALRHC
jgi:predicted RNase H-like nuclease (RuvC/YqgF family)